MSNRILYIAVCLLGLTLLYAVARAVPYGMILFYIGLFACLKPLVGMRSWAHAMTGAAIAGMLYLAYPVFMPSDPQTEWFILKLASFAIIGAVLVGLAMRGRRDGRTATTR